MKSRWMFLYLGVFMVAQEPCEEAPQDDDLGYTCDIEFSALPVAPEVSRSFMALPTSNGFVSATYAIDLQGVERANTDGSSGTWDPSHRLITLTDHVMAQPDASTHTRDFLHDLYFGLRINGQGTWLSDVPEHVAEYVPGTGVIQLVQRVGDVQSVTYIFAPMHGGTRDIVVVASVENLGSTSAEVDLYSLINAHTGGEGHADQESVSQYADGSLVETRNADFLVYQPLSMPEHYAAAPSSHSANPWVALNSGQDLADSLVNGSDVAVGFQWTMGAQNLAPGATQFAGFVIAQPGEDASLASTQSRVSSFIDGRSAEDLLQGELDWWTDFHSIERLPEGLSADELRVFHQSTAVLKMAQVREPGSAYGQILASLPPGGWNISWPRDAAYAIVGLVKSGHFEEARAALNFQIQGQAGTYASWLGLDDYLISACRYYGDGVEESDGATCADGSDAGPNIELDDFGLFLWAYGSYIEESGDVDFKTETLAAVLGGVAEPLLQLTEADTGLLVPDSSIWERHWNSCFPNGRKHFTYSNIMAVEGLKQAYELSGDGRYEQGAATIREGLLNLNGGPAFEVSIAGEACPALASAPEELCEFCGPYDASVVEAINHGVVGPESAIARGTLQSLVSNLSMNNGSPGFLRSDDGSGTTNPHPWYDDQEWVVMDLRMAAAMAKMGQASNNQTLLNNADILLGWITSQARQNSDVIGELLSDGTYTVEDDNDYHNLGQDNAFEYQGSVPMTGFGPGAYILALEAIHNQ